MRPNVLAQLGYEAYGNKADWKAYNDEPMPQWVDLPVHIRERWIAAAEAIQTAVLVPQEKVADEPETEPE